MIRGRHHDYLGSTVLRVWEKMAPESMILFLNVGIQIKVDFDRSPFVFEHTQSIEVDPATFLPFLTLRLRFCFNQRIKRFTHSVLPVLNVFFCNDLAH
jgi:hypothetical protein